MEKEKWYDSPMFLAGLSVSFAIVSIVLAIASIVLKAYGM